MELLPHQRQIINQNPSKYGLFHGTGTGKSLIGLELAKKNCKTCLIICPKTIKEKWRRDSSVAEGGTKFTVMTKEEFKKELKNLPVFDGVLVDEAHSFLSLTSQLSKSLYWYVKTHSIKYLWMMTATPYLSTPWNIYTLARHLGHDWNYAKFKKDFFYEVRMGHRMVPKVKPDIKDKLAELVKTLGSVVSLDEAKDQAKRENHPLAKTFSSEKVEHKFITRNFELTEEQKEGIEGLEDTEFITRWTHTHLIENGVLYSDGYSEHREFECKKTDYVINLCKKTDKIILFCRYTGQIEYLKQKLEALEKPIFTITGKTKDRDSIIQEANNKDHAIMIIQSSISAGYELPTFRTMVFVSLSFSLVDHDQAIGRNDRINKEAQNEYIYLVTKGVDRDVYNAIMDKRDFTFAIYNKGE